MKKLFENKLANDQRKQTWSAPFLMWTAKLKKRAVPEYQHVYSNKVFAQNNSRIQIKQVW